MSIIFIIKIALKNVTFYFNLDTQSPVINLFMYNRNGGSEDGGFYITKPRFTKL